MASKANGARPAVFMWFASVVFILIGGFGLAVRFGKTVPPPTWADIQKDAVAQRWDSAKPKLERWIIANPSHGEALVVLATLNLREGHQSTAVKLLKAVPGSSNFWVPAQTMLGEQALRDRRAAEAELIFRNVASRDPMAIPPRQRLIYLLSLEQRTAEAREILWRLYRIQNDPRILVDLVLEILQDRQDVRGFGPELEEFLKQTPQDSFLQRAWGLALLYQGKAAEALSHLESAARHLENDPTGRFALAECRILLGKSLNLNETLGSCPRQPVDAALWWVNRSRLEETLGRPALAEKSLQSAVQLQPSNKEAQFRLGQLLERLGRAPEAGRYLTKGRELTEVLNKARREFLQVRRSGLARNAHTYKKLGELCREAELMSEARAWFEEALLLDPSSDELRTKLTLPSLLDDSLPVALPRPLLVADSGKSVTTEGTSAPFPEPAKTNSIHPRDPSLDSRSSRIMFEDVSERAGIHYQYDSGASSRLSLPDTTGGGVALIDYDADGWMDVYFVNGCKLPVDGKSPPRPNRLYRNQGDLTFRDVTLEAGVAGQGYGMGCAVGDYDNDGHDDLFLTGLGRTMLYRNRGNGTFEDVTTRAGVASDRWTTAAGFGDLDGDGDLDLVVITYIELPADDQNSCRDYLGKPIHCTPTIYPAQEDLLYRNNGDGTFSEISQQAGFTAPGGRGLGLAIADFDQDDKLDIFVANDASPDFLFRNLGGFQFEEIGASAGVATNGSGRATASMGVVADDLDGDGHIDLFVTNLVNESFTFFRNMSKGFFQDAALGAGFDAPSRPKTGFGDAALDADNDGILDLLTACGHVDDRPWANSPMAQTPLFFRGKGRGRFVLIQGESSPSYFERRVIGRGVAAGDLDNDGRVDLVVVHRDGPAGLLHNLTAGGHWLGVKLIGTRSPKTPVGARVSCHLNGSTITRWLAGGTGYLAAHDSRLWFGLGTTPIIERLEIKWPSGLVQLWNDLQTDRIIEVKEGDQGFRLLVTNGRSDLGIRSGSLLAKAGKGRIVNRNRH